MEQQKQRPYWEQVDSILETVDVATGQRTVLKRFDSLIEAPNWLPEGDALLYNAGGSLWRFDLATGESRKIPTGEADRCNNDHVISPDGKQVGLSHGTAGFGSRVYVAPLSGGEARLVTPVGPSYLHGWSPDGKTLAYCAQREGEFDIYTMPVAGGEETRLTDAPGLDDGPEYSPDGRHIWFNSVRSGLMQVWRMEADGQNQTRMTWDEGSNCWFPHLSPDGEQVAYIAYKKGDVAPGDHPPCKDVEIRLMDKEGQNTRVLVKLFGGQGTLNVNSWSPDGTRLAFVSYAYKE